METTPLQHEQLVENNEEKRIVGIIVQLLRAGYGFSAPERERVVQLGETLCEAMKRAKFSSEFVYALRDRANQLQQCNLFHENLESEMYQIGKRMKNILG